MNIKSIWQGPAALGECPLWHVKEQVLYWVDIAEAMLYRLDPVTNALDTWQMPAPIGCIAPRVIGGLIGGIGNEICFIDLPSGKVRPQIKVPSKLRLNDGKCDRQGRFWVGTACPDKPLACLYRFDPDGRLHKMEENIFISNGLGWSPDNSIFYYTDSIVGKIYAYDFDTATGAIKQQRIFAQITTEDGVPDGLTVDSQGRIWSARWNGWKVVCYAVDGKIIQEINMSVQRPTSCMFGGAQLNILYVTSCSRDINESKSQILPPPSGALFAINVGVQGLPEPFFAG